MLNYYWVPLLVRRPFNLLNAWGSWRCSDYAGHGLVTASLVSISVAQCPFKWGLSCCTPVLGILQAEVVLQWLWILRKIRFHISSDFQDSKRLMTIWLLREGREGLASLSPFVAPPNPLSFRTSLGWVVLEGVQNILGIYSPLRLKYLQFVTMSSWKTMGMLECSYMIESSALNLWSLSTAVLTFGRNTELTLNSSKSA